MTLRQMLDNNNLTVFGVYVPTADPKYTEEVFLVNACLAAIGDRTQAETYRQMLIIALLNFDVTLQERIHLAVKGKFRLDTHQYVQQGADAASKQEHLARKDALFASRYAIEGKLSDNRSKFQQVPLMDFEPDNQPQSNALNQLGFEETYAYGQPKHITLAGALADLKEPEFRLPATKYKPDALPLSTASAPEHLLAPCSLNALLQDICQVPRTPAGLESLKRIHRDEPNKLSENSTKLFEVIMDFEDHQIYNTCSICGCKTDHVDYRDGSDKLMCHTCYRGK